MDPGMVDPRLIPGGSFDSTPIGVNAFDREDLPSGGVAFPAVNESDDPDMSDEEASRAPLAPEGNRFAKK
jgi:hypothetical protein